MSHQGWVEEKDQLPWPAVNVFPKADHYAFYVVRLKAVDSNV